MEPYPHPLDGEHVSEALTFREQYLRQFSGAIRNKTNWTEKILDRALFAKWLREALENGGSVSYGKKINIWNREDVAFVYRELTEGYKPYVEKLRAEGGTAVGVEPDMDGVWRSDVLVDDAVRQQLIDAVATLENVPEDQKDWHPGSDGQVLDLVHPSMWPIVYGRSINILDGKPIELPDNAIEDSFSDNFCWLPSEFEVDEDGKVKVASYINNLAAAGQQELFHPILENIFERFLPLFNHVLADLRAKKFDFRRVPSPDGYTEDGEEVEWLRAEKHKEKWEELLGEFERGEELTVDFSKHVEVFEQGDDEEDEAFEEREGIKEDWENDWWSGRRKSLTEEKYKKAPFQVRDMGELGSDIWTPPEVTDEIKLEGKTAKVIVKLANIILTPEKPTYGGGSWHVEAMMNERIISTGIYYYAQENVTQSELEFRRTIPEVDDYSLPQDSNWTTVHNMGREGNLVQEIGSILTKENRAIAFPNIYQHQVQPFKLVDNTKPGYRKILVFFLCDPTEENTAPTSRIVAPQQPGARKEVEELLRKGPLGKLPEEVFRLILEQLPPPISREEAEKYREELMAERTGYLEGNELVQGLEYSLCEH
ncbi:hypothetical protein Dda_8942 [Drechslerella dactyloides]|uniref:Uncharacterized protein n=1 Tax=Drechslerella dactyloides TaxID=74499 RepID=A0AAD6IT15_DREDA|nr:hypothetical protein Dda_8942 [Drechslerella dactyloides]